MASINIPHAHTHAWARVCCTRLNLSLSLSLFHIERQCTARMSSVATKGCQPAQNNVQPFAILWHSSFKLNSIISFVLGRGHLTVCFDKTKIHVCECVCMSMCVVTLAKSQHANGFIFHVKLGSHVCQPYAVQQLIKNALIKVHSKWAQLVFCLIIKVKCKLLQWTLYKCNANLISAAFRF